MAATSRARVTAVEPLIVLAIQSTPSGFGLASGAVVLVLDKDFTPQRVRPGSDAVDAVVMSLNGTRTDKPPLEVDFPDGGSEFSNGAFSISIKPKDEASWLAGLYSIALTAAIKQGDLVVKKGVGILSIDRTPRVAAKKR